MTDLTEQQVREILAGVDGVTPGPWQVVQTKHPWFMSAQKVLGTALPERTGSHLERRIFTTWEHGQLKAPFPVVNSSHGVGDKDGPPVQMVSMSAEVAAHIARLDPQTVSALCTMALDSLFRRAADAAVRDAARNSVLAAATLVDYLAGWGVEDGELVDPENDRCLPELKTAWRDYRAANRALGQFVDLMPALKSKASP